MTPPRASIRVVVGTFAGVVRATRGGGRCRVRTSAGFTLVELLVVIGITAVLVGLLLPVLSRVRAQANTLKCAAQMRQLGSAMMLHAAERKGHIPLAGEVVLAGRGGQPSGPARQQVALGDVGGKRYSYSTVQMAGGVIGLLSYNAALAPYLDRAFKLDTSDDSKLLEQLNDPRGPWKYFRCPTTDSGDKAVFDGGSWTSTGTEAAVLSVTYTDNRGDYSFWVDTDYLINEGVTGYHADPRFRRMRGLLSAVRSPDRTFLMIDGTYSLEGSGMPWATIAPADKPSGTQQRAYTLAEHFRKPEGPDSFDAVRHRGRANVLFVDGHVETRRITAGDLEQVLILPAAR